MSLAGAEPLAVMSVAVAELLPGVGSDVALLIVAVLLNDVPPGVAAGMPTNMNIDAEGLVAIDAAVQVTVPFVPTAGAEQLSPGASTPWYVKPAGRTSVIVTLVAVAGPWFDRSSRKTVFSPAYAEPE
jgi:hypothetical protein